MTIWRWISIITTTITSLVCFITAINSYLDDPYKLVILISISILLSNQSVLLSEKK